MRVQVGTKVVLRKGRPDPVEILVEIAILPRGGGNRRYARAIAKGWRERPELKDHIKRVACGTSKVVIHLRPSVELARTMAEMQAEDAKRNVPGQQMLFGVA